MLDGSLAAGFADVFGRFYRPALLRRADYTDDGKGNVTECRAPWTARAQLDVSTQRSQQPGYPETDATIIILAYGLPNGVRDDDELEMDQVVYRLSGPTLDPLKSHWKCGARRKP